MIDAYSSAAEFAAAIKSRIISSLELTEMYIGRVEKNDPQINAVIVHDFERGRKAAVAADESLARGEDLGLLHCVPMTIKQASISRSLCAQLAVQEGSRPWFSESGTQETKETNKPSPGRICGR